MCPHQSTRPQHECNATAPSSRGDWPSFEPLVAAFIDAVLSPTPETVVATRVLKLTA